ncbi:PKD domain-containing protein [Maribacter algicola]|uniref:PKD domain-containing protein n=1 Tax=Maribacter algicola TaxID=2498892 RepID=A0A426RIP4_9FLAO|nr:PKD domain-containing protein [Maribacter algicola]RRQ48857.1 PKD domain-containing protein [Maribacter algicola]
MKKNYTLNSKTIRKYIYFIAFTGLAAGIAGFGPMFMGPGMTNPEPFSLGGNTAFPPGGVGTPAFESAFPNITFDSPIAFLPVPNDNSRIVVAQLNGEIYAIGSDNATNQKQLIVNWAPEVGDRNEGAVWDGGFLGLAIHPQFGVDPTKNLMFAYYSTNAANNGLGTGQGFSCNKEDFSGNYLILERFRVNPATMAFVAGSREMMIRRELYNTTHRGGGMTFGMDGYLYLTTGDQATYASAQDIANNLDGGVLRLDVDMIGGATSHAPKRFLQDPGVGNTNPGTPGFLPSAGLEMSGAFYFIPNDNPYNVPLGNTTSPVFEEYYTIGHRSPHRLTMDSATGDLYIGEVGESTHEEINVLRNTPSTAGKNYGWPLWEGNANFNPNCTPALTQLYNNNPHEGPLTDFVRSEAGSIIGGYVYRGSIAQFQGRYIAADYQTNQMFAINTQSGAKENLGVGPGQVISFGQDRNGELYMLTLGAGGDSGIFRLTESINTNGAPQLLSETGVFNTGVNNDFSDIGELTVTQGFIPYEMIDPFWSDGAYKRRWMAIPNDGSHNSAAEQIQWSENGDWQFPIGSVLVKHFNYPIDDTDPNVTRKIETRFSIKGTNGQFYFLTYKWNATETDATLVDMTVGDNATISVATSGGGTRNVNWLYPNNAQCIECHSPALGGSLGPRTRFLNKDFDYAEKSGTVGNQLVTLSALGILNQTITDLDTPGYLTHKAMDDLNASLDERARSYLDNNCAYCHQPATGNASPIDLRLSNSLAQTRVLTTIGNNIPGEPTINYIVVPGDAANSQLYHRANSLTPGVKMPPVAKGIIDTEGVALLEAWINQLQPPANPPTPGNYRIVNRATGETLQVPDGTQPNGANIAGAGYEGLPKQHFALEEPIAGDFQLRVLHSNKYADVQGGSTAMNANVWQFQGNLTPSQTWEIIDAGDGTFNIISKLSGYFLGQDATGNVRVLENDLSDFVRWEFRPTSPPLTIGLEVTPSLVITGEDGTNDELSIRLKSAPDTDVVVSLEGTGALDEFSLSTNQLTFTNGNWNEPQLITVFGQNDGAADGVQYYGIEVDIVNAQSDPDYAGFSETIGGYNEDDDGGAAGPPAPSIYRIINEDTGLSMEVLNAGIPDGTNVLEGPYEGNAHEQFELIFMGGGLYSFVVQHTGKAIDVQGSNPAAGTNIWQYTFSNSTTNLAQVWTLEDAGNGTYYIISERGGHYLTVEPNGNIQVNINDGSDRFKWRFEDTQNLNNAGLTMSDETLYTDEDGDEDTFTVVLDEMPTAQVNIGLFIIQGDDEITLSTNQLSFDSSNWNIPQTITVTGVDDTVADGVQEFTIEALVVAPINDPSYDEGVGDLLSGLNYDNDGGDNGAPRPGIYQIQNVGNTNNLTPENGGLVWRTNMLTQLYDASSFQHFELVDDGNGLYKLKLVDADMYVDIELGNTAAGANVWTYTSNIFNAQKWSIVEAGNETYHIISALTANRYLTVDGTGNVVVNQDNGDDAFRWRFLPTGFPPEAIASANVTSGNVDLEVQFTGSASTDDKNDIVSYLWDFGNGDTSNAADPVYTYTQGGTFTSTLTVTDGDGYTDISDSIEVVVNGRPVAVATADILTGIAPLEVNFTGNQSTDDQGITSYSWVFGDSGTSTESNPTRVFEIPGTYIVELTVQDEGGLEDTASVTITVNDNMPPVAVASANVTEGDAPLEVQFTGSQSTDDIAVVTYTWDFGDGSSSTEADPVHTFNIAGTYSVILAVTDGSGQEDTETIEITVNPAPGAPVANATSDITEGNAPLEVSFNSDQSTDDGTIESFEWDFGDGGTSTEANPVYTFNTAGTFTVTLTVTDDQGLMDNDTLEIVVTSLNAPPTAVANSNVTTGPAPLQVNFTGDQSIDDDAVVSYRWDLGDGTILNEANVTHIYNTPGVYLAVLRVTDAEGLEDTDSITITVAETGQAPIAIATSDVSEGVAPLEVTFTGDQSTVSSGDIQYAWDFGDGNTSAEANPVHTFTEVGEYSVVLTIMDGEGTTDTETLTIVVNEDNETLEEPSFEFVLAPNPSSEFVEVIMSDNFDMDEIIGVMLHDMSGRLIRQYTLNEVLAGNVIRIPVSVYRNEVYVVTVMFNNNEPVSRRLVIRN